jgi:hypothetical protein
MIERGYGSGIGPTNMHDVVQEIQAQAGSDRKAAAMVGVHHRTWQRWRKGEAKPNPLNLERVGSAVRAVRADARPLTPGGLVLKTKGHDQRNRTIRGDQLGFNASHTAAIQRAYVDHGADAAARAFMNALGGTAPGQDWYSEYFEDLSYEGYEPDDEDSYSAASGSASW